MQHIGNKKTRNDYRTFRVFWLNKINTEFMNTYSAWEKTIGCYFENDVMVACTWNDTTFEAETMFLFDSKERAQEEELIRNMLKFAKTFGAGVKEDGRTREVILCIPRWNKTLERLAKEKGFRGLCILICTLIIYKCFIAGYSMPIFKENAISEYRTVTLGGIEQSLLIRGNDKSNPVLLYIHGGPGDPETPMIVPYQKEWEEYLKDTFQVEKIYLVGHSYGTYVGMKCVQMNPDDYYAYVGMGQVGDQQLNEKKLISYATKMAKKEGNQEALNELATLGDLPYSKKEFGSKISLSRKWTTYYGGAIYGERDTNRFIVEALYRPEYSLFDLMGYLGGEALYYTNTEEDQVRWELFNASLAKEGPSVEVPIYFVQGENDYTTSFKSCEEYFNILEAPYKELIPLTECAHNPIVEKTKEVSEILINKVRNI